MLKGWKYKLPITLWVAFMCAMGLHYEPSLRKSKKEPVVELFRIDSTGRIQIPSYVGSFNEEKEKRKMDTTRRFNNEIKKRKWKLV